MRLPKTLKESVLNLLIVRCKDCKYLYMYEYPESKSIGYFCNHPEHLYDTTNLNDFCSYGEEIDYGCKN